MPVQVIVLNGASSSGKSSLTTCLQAILPDPWLALGIDSLIHAMPASIEPASAGIQITVTGEAIVGEQFLALQDAWIDGVATMARAGARIIVDEVFLGGATAQRRWQQALDGLSVLWVGVRCDTEVAAGREIARGNRAAGLARSQSAVVHQGVRYDLEVDTTCTESIDCARAVAARLGGEARRPALSLAGPAGLILPASCVTR